MDQTTPTPTPTEERAIPPTPADAAKVALGQAVKWTQVFTAYLEAVVPIDRGEVEDVTGGRHTFGLALPMGAQLATSLRVERFLAAYATPEISAEVVGRADAVGYREGLRYFLVTATENERAKKDLQEIFAGCHPKLLHYAQKNAATVWEDEDHDLSWLWRASGHTEAPTHVMQLFEADALLESLVPFFARFVRRTGQSIARLTGATTSQPAPSPDSSPPSPFPPSGS